MSEDTDTLGLAPHIEQPGSWPQQRKEAIRRDGGRCQFCEMTEREHQDRDRGGRGLSVHHKLPQSEGGTDELSNLITVCEPCHKLLESITRDVISKCRDGYIPEAGLYSDLIDSVLRPGIEESARLKEYLTQTPTVNEAYGPFSPAKGPGEYPFLCNDDGVDVRGDNISGEREFWFCYGVYTASVMSAIHVGDHLSGTPPNYDEALELAGVDDPFDGGGGIR